VRFRLQWLNEYLDKRTVKGRLMYGDLKPYPLRKASAKSSTSVLKASVASAADASWTGSTGSSLRFAVATRTVRGANCRKIREPFLTTLRSCSGQISSAAR